MDEKDIAYVYPHERATGNFETTKKWFQKVYKDWREAHKGLGDEKFRVLDPYIYHATWEKDKMSKTDWIKDNVPKTYSQTFNISRDLIPKLKIQIHFSCLNSDWYVYCSTMDFCTSLNAIWICDFIPGSIKIMRFYLLIRYRNHVKDKNPVDSESGWPDHEPDGERKFLNNAEVIVKPTNSSASAGVKVCYTMVTMNAIC
jgi:hypothetical protein